MNNILEKITLNRLFEPDDEIILAVSGGCDSVVMAHLMKRLVNKMVIAHCNFRLRGQESDEDENFVKSLAEKLQVPFYVKHFDTDEYALLQKISIQEAARELRYNWFENLRRNLKYKFISVAHNADDSIETFFINLIRGTGINGLTGIKSGNGNIIRPLINLSRAEIESFAREQAIDYRTDSSNATDKYLRNNIRHNIIPLFRQIEPSFHQIMIRNMGNIAEASTVYHESVKKQINEVMEKQADDTVIIDIEKLLTTGFAEAILFEILKNQGFNSYIISDIKKHLKAESGKIFYGKNRKLLIDRNNIIIKAIEDNDPVNDFIIEQNISLIDFPVKIKFETLAAEGYALPRNPSVAALDADKIKYPLVLRKWEHGDYFKPLGLNGMKKLSDFFIDLKLPVFEKEKVWILTSAEQIVWICGIRIDDRYKICHDTQRVLQITMI